MDFESLKTSNSGFDKLTTYDFYLEALCDNCATAPSAPSSTVDHYFYI